MSDSCPDRTADSVSDTTRLRIRGGLALAAPCARDRRGWGSNVGCGWSWSGRDSGVRRLCRAGVVETAMRRRGESRRLSREPGPDTVGVALSLGTFTRIIFNISFSFSDCVFKALNFEPTRKQKFTQLLAHRTGDNFATYLQMESPSSFTHYSISNISYAITRQGRRRTTETGVLDADA